MLRRILRKQTEKAQKHITNSGRWVKYVRGGDQTKVGVVNPDPNPYGDYFKYIYMQNTDPELMNGLDKPYPSSYKQSMMYEWDNFQFEYFGQWFDHGSPLANWFWITLPVTLFLVLFFESVWLFFLYFEFCFL